MRACARWYSIALEGMDPLPQRPWGIAPHTSHCHNPASHILTIMHVKTKSIKKLIQLSKLYPDHWVYSTIFTSSIVPEGLAPEEQEGKFNIPAIMFGKIPIALAQQNQKASPHSDGHPEELTQEELEILDAFLKAKEMDRNYTFGKFRSAFKNLFPESANWDKISKNAIHLS